MNYVTGFPQDVLPIYLMASIILIVLVIEAFNKIKSRAWAIPALAVYFTTAMWYFIELIYTPERFYLFSSEIIGDCYFQIILFLISFRLFLPPLYSQFIKNYQHVWRFSTLNPANILNFLAIIWLFLLIYGITRLDGNIFKALFPIASRAGGHMWGRAAGAGAGSTGFIISFASYTYLLVCSFFGALLPLQNQTWAKFLNLSLMLISWPYFILMGSRNQLLAVALPVYFSYLLFSRQEWWKKALITVITFLVLNQVFTLIIAYRNEGFVELLNASKPSVEISEQKHLGLNMLEELSYINNFYHAGMLHPSLGSGYLAELANIIPRVIWPEKPLIGIDYALLRGMGGGSSDIGVFATLSTGFIGQGLMNFGPYIGPIAPGFILACWTAILSRLWSQRYSTLRFCLFLACLTLTFNLGRDITLLVLWPAIFGYLLVRLLENLSKGRKNSAASPYSYIHKS